MLDFKEISKFLNIDKWQKDGYTGKGIKVMSTEKESEDDYHKERVHAIIRAVAPACEILNYYWYGSKKIAGERWYRMNDAIDYAIKNNVDIISISQTGRSEKYYADAIDRAISHGIIVLNSSGNTYREMTHERSKEHYASVSKAIDISAISSNSLDDFKREQYASYGDELEFTNFANFKLDKYSDLSGTSFSTPLTAGMVALAHQKNKFNNQQECLEYMKHNALDIGDNGKDKQFGYGIFRLPKEDKMEIIRDLSELHPYVESLAIKLINECIKEDVKILVTETYRSFERQEELYNKGRTTEGNIVTNAKAGDSIHNYRLAFDVCPMVNGRCAWNRHDLFDKIGEIGENLGLTWGGHFKTITDKPHFQWTGGLTLKELKEGDTPVSPTKSDTLNYDKLENSWEKDGFDYLLDNNFITGKEYWSKRWERDITIKEMMGLLGKIEMKRGER